MKLTYDKDGFMLYSCSDVVGRSFDYGLYGIPVKRVYESDYVLIYNERASSAGYLCFYVHKCRDPEQMLDVLGDHFPSMPFYSWYYREGNRTLILEGGKECMLMKMKYL